MSNVVQEDRQHQSGGSSAQLHYAPSERSRRHGQRGLIVAALLFFALSSFVWGPGVWVRTNFLYYQWRLSSATPPAGTVVLDSQVSGGALPPLHAAFWKTRRHTHNVNATNVTGAPVWSQRMTTVSGSKRIVTIYATDEIIGNGRWLVLRAYAADLRPWYWVIAPHSDSRQRTAASLALSQWHFDVRPQEQVLVEAARRNPNDHTQILIPYELDGEEGMIRATLSECAGPPGTAGVKFERKPTGPLDKRLAGGGSSF